jgi:uncharacterized membrane protein
MIEVKLSGTDTATCGDLVVVNRKAPICEMARALEDAGARPLAPMIVTRNGVLCFAATPVAWWADRTVREADKTGKLVKRGELDASVFASGAVAAAVEGGGA